MHIATIVPPLQIVSNQMQKNVIDMIDKVLEGSWLHCLIFSEYGDYLMLVTTLLAIFLHLITLIHSPECICLRILDSL